MAHHHHPPHESQQHHKHRHAPTHRKPPPKKPASPPYQNGITPPTNKRHFIHFRGYGPNRQDSFDVMCGDDPPTIVGGYAKWGTVDRPLMRGVTVFQGYDPVKMTLSLRFGSWDQYGWSVDNDGTGASIEQQIETLEWMAGANFVAGQSPFVYVNTYGPAGGTTNLIPYEYQTTVGVSGSMSDGRLWPWVIAEGIQWGKAWRAEGGNRVYQECTVTLTNFQGLTKPPTRQSAGSYFRSSAHMNDVLLIAGSPQFHALDVQSLAHAIQTDRHNNPIPGTRIHLKDHTLRWPIPVGKSVFIPGHVV